ncbi:hypothetical protein BJP34_22910 [Moorena producens PAL-8-15-08-1]|uniref:Uncharacterized protein n=1 Tax=Moorena producens PAL-8-15-08-1 TaxID=1458985 RepID=A0A1D8TW72_9CYAN|nr:hypothetical protein [Moorena producens]AOX01902.1 hypothetical protein BJP34_22910 [Moorena producens PAL-8-15-08-1]
MAQRLKRWESPRRQGRNWKGKGGSARRKQLKKQTQMLRRKLKESPKALQNRNQDKHNQYQNQQGGRDINALPYFFCRTLSKRIKIFLEITQTQKYLP